MAKLSSIHASIKSHDGYVSVTADVKVSTRGEFTATVNTENLMKLKDYLPDMKEENPKKVFTAERYDDLQPMLRRFLEEAVSCTLAESKEVIRYDIQTRCHYCKSDKEDGEQIYPNGNWLPKRLLKQMVGSGCPWWEQGTDSIENGFPEPFGINLFCKVYRKNTYEYKNGRQITRYEEVNPINMDENKFDNLSWIKSIVKMNPSRNMRELQEIDATEENAAVFVQLIKFICKANEIIKTLASPDNLLEFIKTNSHKQINL